MSVRRSLSTFVWLFACVLPANGAAQGSYPTVSGSISDEARQQDWHTACLRTKDAKLPPSDIPPAQVVGRMGRCDAQTLYYEGRSQSDWRRAKQCAIATDEYAVLMMVYANGRGGVQDFDLAVHFACRMGGAPAEVSGRVSHLELLRQQGTRNPVASSGQKSFDQCDDITSGFMMGICADIQEARDRKLRARALAGLTKGWPENHLAAFARLRKALAVYASARADGEADMTGTARVAIAIEAKAEQEAEFVRNLRDFEKGRLPKFSQEQYAELDRKLNELYGKIQNNPDYDYGTVTKEGIRRGQRAWLRYRNAWLELGKIRYPTVDENSWRAFSTEKRIVQLSELAD